MGFVKVANKNDIGSAGMMGVEVKGKEFCLVKLGNTYYAIGNRCTHRGCMLSNGELVGENIKCNCHGSVFSVKTGKVFRGPAKSAEPTYPAKVEDDQILIDV